MKRFLLLFMCVAVLTGCRAEENEGITSEPSTPIIEEMGETMQEC